MGKTTYNPDIIEVFADSLYTKAESIVTFYTTLGILVGISIIWYGKVSYGTFNIIFIIVAFITTLIGYQVGAEKAFWFKLQAQSHLCILQIEKNTRNIREFILNNTYDRQIKQSSANYFYKQENEVEARNHNTVINGDNENDAQSVNGNTKDDENIMTLHQAASRNRRDRVEHFLIEGIDVNEKDKNGETPLHKAADKGHKEIGELLISEGAGVNIRNNDGRMPLHLAACRGYTEVLELLIKYRAEINAQDNNGWTPLHCTISNGHTEASMLLIEKGADTDT